MLLRTPLTFGRRFQRYLWGGRNLARLVGPDVPEGPVAESWEISAHPAAPTVVDEGPLAGVTLPDLVADFGVELVGSRGEWAVDRGTFPLLFKLLDAAQPLSVQVHPDDAYAAEHEGGELGKTEMWYVLEAAPGAEIIYGLKQGTTADAFRLALEERRLSECLHRRPVRAGDSVLIEAGTVHAILQGIVIAEIQQSSNTTYRIHDWDRVGPDGQPRELHTEKAMDVIDFRRWEPALWVPSVLTGGDGVTRELIADCDKFTVERVSMAEGSCFSGALTGETFEAWGFLNGTGRIGCGDRTVGLEAVRFALLPATAGPFRVEALTDLVALRAYLPAS